MAARSVTERLADYVVDLQYEDIPAPVIEKTKDHLIHHFGLAFRGHGAENSRRALEVAYDLSGPGGDCSVIGERRPANLLEAVFANSLLMGHLGLDDFHLPAGLHPGAITQPVALAFGERERASGRELLAAVVAGYDVAGKLGNTVWTWSSRSPRRPNPVFAPFGSAATAARLLGLAREQTADALGHAAHAAMGLVEGGEHQWPLHPLLARNGAMAAVLARSGMPMVASMIEGRHGLFQTFFGCVPEGLESDLSTLGQEFEISRAQTKRYRGSGINIVPMQLMLDLTNTHALRADNVADIAVTLPDERAERESVMEAALEKPSANSTNRLGSLRFQLAVIVTDGAINPSRYDEPPQPPLRDVLEKVRLRFESGRPITHARIDVTTTDGQRYSASEDDQVFPAVDWAEWLEGGRRLLAAEQLSRLERLIADLPDVDDVSQVTACVRPCSPPRDPREWACEPAHRGVEV